MGRKKKKQSKPWCWYCNREFDDEKILIQHQKAKHFKCHICHKKLFTGPGLSIHCMQVHKEAIDKVPNSLSNRSNIDIEIYGMEGIPPEDLKEHERQKLGKMGRAASPSSGEDEPPTKKKADGPSGLTPGLGLMGGARPSLSQPPGMPPGALPPGYPMMSMGHMPPFMPPGMGMMPGSSMQPSVPSPHLQNKPLFPSAAAIASSSGPSTINDTKTTSTTAGTVKPTFPAYSASGVASGSSSSSDSQKVSLITTVGGSSKIIHPPEDISLEEFKAKLPKYQTNSPVGNSTSAAVAGVGTTDEAQSSPSPSVATSSNTSQAGQPQQLQQPPIDTKPMERRIPPPVNRMPVMSVSAPGMLPPASASMIMSMAGPHGLMRGPPTIPLIPASMPLLRHQIPMHPGLIGGMVPPPGAVYGGGAPLGAFPGPPLMLPPRFR